MLQRITSTTWCGRCDKCGGQMFIDQDEFSRRFKHCLQCGKIVELDVPTPKLELHLEDLNKDKTR
jgi:hypothetical protein